MVEYDGRRLMTRSAQSAQIGVVGVARQEADAGLGQLRQVAGHPGEPQGRRTQEPHTLLAGACAQGWRLRTRIVCFGAAASRCVSVPAVWVWQRPLLGFLDEEATLEACHGQLYEATSGALQRLPGHVPLCYRPAAGGAQTARAGALTRGDVSSDASRRVPDVGRLLAWSVLAGVGTCQMRLPEAVSDDSRWAR